MDSTYWSRYAIEHARIDTNGYVARANKNQTQRHAGENRRAIWYGISITNGGN